MSQFEIQQSSFEGPLDVLLSLLHEKKLEINEVSLSDVTKDYLAYLDGIDDVHAAELADFLVIAAKLLLLKSHALLPQLLPDEDDAVSLEDQLKLYRMFVDASKSLNEWWLDMDKRSFVRIEPPRMVAVEDQTMPENLSLDAMHTVMKSLVRRLAPAKALPRTRIDKTVSLREKVTTLRNIFSKGSRYSFRELLADKESRSEIIVSFLAILELIKHRHITVEQDDAFTDMVIRNAS